MSNYKDFIKDFPKRCLDILDITYETACLRDREVTLILALASSGLIFPLERLRKDGQFVHPSGDEQGYRQASSQMETLLEGAFKTSELHSATATTWRYVKIPKRHGSPNDWPELDRLPSVDSQLKTRNVVYIIRNALAHGNVYTKPAGRRPIQDLIFVSGGKKRKPQNGQHEFKPYVCVAVSPEDFQEFLKSWFAFLSKLKMFRGQ